MTKSFDMQSSKLVYLYSNSGARNKYMYSTKLVRKNWLGTLKHPNFSLSFFGNVTCVGMKAGLMDSKTDDKI